MTTAGLALPATRRRGLYWDAFYRLRANRLAVIAMFIVLAFVFVAIFANVIAPYSTSEQFFVSSASTVVDPLAQRSTGKYEAPSRTHVFGTDQLARDIFSRSVVGLRISLSAAAFAIVVVSVVGMVVGTTAAMSPGWLDDVIMRSTDVVFAVPDLLLIILLRSAFGQTLFGRSALLGVDANVLLLFIAIAITAWPTLARLVRGQLLAIREMEFVTAARALGCSPLRIALRHMLPNALSPVIIEATFLVPRAIIAEATLSFIGLGVAPPTPSLGLLIHDHFQFVGVQWTALAIPCAMLAVLFMAFQFFGDGLRDALDPRSSD